MPGMPVTAIAQPSAVQRAAVVVVVVEVRVEVPVEVVGSSVTLAIARGARDRVQSVRDFMAATMRGNAVVRGIGTQ